MLLFEIYHSVSHPESQPQPKPIATQKMKTCKYLVLQHKMTIYNDDLQLNTIEIIVSNLAKLDCGLHQSPTRPRLQCNHLLF